MEEFKNLILFLTMFVVGVFLEVVIAEGHYWFTKKHFKENHYTWGKYLFLFLFPILGFLIIVGRSGLSILSVFIVFSIVGTALEGIVGFAYHKIVGQRLWTFHKYSLWQYTSWLSLPIWGFIGVIFYLISKLF